MLHATGHARMEIGKVLNRPKLNPCNLSVISITHPNFDCVHLMVSFFLHALL